MYVAQTLLVLVYTKTKTKHPLIYYFPTSAHSLEIPSLTY